MSDLFNFALIALIISSVKTETGSHLTTASTPTTEPETACIGTSDLVCSGHGSCQNNTCVCEDGWSGRSCEMSHTIGFCNAYQQCAECTAMHETCPVYCANVASFSLVFGLNSRTSASFHVCRFSNDVCSSSFQMQSEGANGLKRIEVVACGYDRLRVTSPTTITTTELETACLGTGDLVCSGHGICQNNTCVVCEYGWSGKTCEMSYTVGFCNIYRQCAECTAMHEPCPVMCSNVAKFKLVFGVRGPYSFRHCRFSNDVCSSSFQHESTDAISGLKTIEIVACGYDRSRVISSTTVPTTTRYDNVTKSTTVLPDALDTNVTKSTMIVSDDTHSTNTETDDIGVNETKDRNKGDENAAGRTMLPPNELFVILTAIVFGHNSLAMKTIIW